MDLDADSDSPSIKQIKKKRRKEARKTHRDKISKDYENRAAVDDSFMHFLGSLQQEVKKDETDKITKITFSSSAMKASGQPTPLEITERLNRKKNIEEESSEFLVSEEDDKDDPNFFVKDDQFYSLPVHVRKAILKGKLSARHSDFYHKLTDLNAKIGLYKKLFYNKIPEYQMQYMMKRLDAKERK